MATLRLVNYSSYAGGYWRFALGTSASGVPLQDLSYIYSFTILTANYYDLIVEIWDATGSILIKSIPLNGYLTVNGEYQVDAVSGILSEIVSGQPPATPTLNSPANGANVPGTGITFSWSAMGGATYYELEILKGGFLETTVTVISNSVLVDIANVGYGFPNDGSTFAWRVRACNSYGCSAWPTQFSFINGVGALTAPVLVSPAADANVPGTSITFQWNPVSGADSYTLQVYDVNAGAEIYNANVGNVTSKVLNIFPDTGKQYQWAVTAFQGSTPGPASAWRTLVNGSAPVVPSPPVLSSPAAGATIVGNSVTFNWQPAPGADDYLFYCWETISGVWKRQGFIVSGIEYIDTGFPNDGKQYSWCVYSRNAAGTGPQSEVRNFYSGAATIPTEFSGLTVAFSML